MRIVAFLLAASLALAGCLEPPADLSPDRLVPYSNSQHGFSMSYPEGWSVRENAGDFFAVAFESYGEAIQVMPPLPTESLSLKELAAKFVSGYKEGVAQAGGGRVNVVFDGPSVIRGQPAHIVVIELEGEVGYKAKTVVIQSRKNPAEAYGIAVSAPKTVYLRNSAAYDAAIESFSED